MRLWKDKKRMVSSQEYFSRFMLIYNLFSLQGMGVEDNDVLLCDEWVADAR